MILSIYIAVCLVLGVLSYGVTFAFFQREWPSLAEEHYASDLGFAVCIGILAFAIPPVILVALIGSVSFKHGVKFK